MFYVLGKSWQEKIRELRENLKKKRAYALVVTALDEVACKCIVLCCIVLIGPRHRLS